MRYAYYPGCLLERNSAAYDASLRAVADVLRIELVEIEDWNCCGGTKYFSQDELTACAVIARNLALIDPRMDQVIAPCATCLLNLRKVDRLMIEQPPLGRQINEALAAGGLRYEPGRIRVRHVLDVLWDDIGELAIRDKVVRPLRGLRVAPYYGCQVVRPWGEDDPERPMRLDNVLSWLGADVVDYALKTHCCGGHMTQISQPQAFELIRRLLQAANHAQADLLVCLCPICQLNLDAFQGQVTDHFGTRFGLPIVFVTQLVGFAFGLDAATLGLGKEFVPARPAIAARLEQGEGERTSRHRGAGRSS